MRQSRPGTGDAPRSSDTTGGQDAAIVFATRIGVALFGILIQGMLARALLPEGRGSYAVCVVFVLLLGVFFTPGAQQGTQYFVMTGQIGVSQGISSAFIISLAGAGLAVVLALPMVHSDVAYFKKAEARTFHLALILLPLMIFSMAVDCQLAAFRRFGRLAVFTLIRLASNTLAILVLVWGLEAGVEGAILSFAAGHLIMIALCLRDLRRHCGLVPAAPSRANLTRIVGYGLRYHIARISDTLELYIGVFMLGLIASQAEIGLFAVANTLMFQFAALSNAVGNALLPRIAGRERPELVALCLRLVCGMTAVALLALLAISEPLVQLLFSEAFLPAVPFLWLLAPGILAYAGASMYMAYFKAVNRPEVCSWAACLGTSAILGAFFLLYPKLGVRAAACAVSIGMLCRCLLLGFVFRKMTGMAWLSVWLPRHSDASFLWKITQSVLGRWTKGKGAASPRRGNGPNSAMQNKETTYADSQES